MQQTAAQRAARDVVPAVDGKVAVILRIPLQADHISMSWNGITIPLPELTAQDVTLAPGDRIRAPRKQDRSVFVTGALNRTNTINCTVCEREPGNAFLIPPNRDIDVVMAGYIDPLIRRRRSPCMVGCPAGPTDNSRRSDPSLL